jgi:hypothetical protein
MNVGTLIPPIEISVEQSRRAQLQAAADSIVDSIWDLVPDATQEKQIQTEREWFQFEANLYNHHGETVEIPPDLEISHGSALSKFVHRTTLFNTLRDNLQLPIQPLKMLHTEPPLDDLLAATQAILSYLHHENPHYFTYRYGTDEGKAMGSGIHELDTLIRWAKKEDYRVSARTIRSYQRTDTGEIIVSKIPDESDKW